MKYRLTRVRTVVEDEAVENHHAQLTVKQAKSYLKDPQIGDEVIDEVMLNEPGYWKKYYRPTWSQAMVDIHFSLSDRIRYYWPHPRIRQSVEKLIANLTDAKLPLGLISQYMPVQFERLSLNELNAEPHALILDKIQDVLRAYRYGCSSETA